MFDIPVYSVSYDSRLRITVVALGAMAVQTLSEWLVDEIFERRLNQQGLDHEGCDQLTLFKGRCE